MKLIRGHFMLALFAAMIILIVAAIYSYMMRSIDMSLADSIKSHQALQSAISLQNREKSFLEKYENTEKDWARLTGFFVSSGNIVDFIEAVESLGSSAGVAVKLSSIDADNLESAKNGTAGSVRARVETEGSWSAMMRILRLAEVMPYRILLDNVSLDLSDPGSSKDGRSVWHLSFNITAAMLVNGGEDGIAEAVAAASK